jgi:hypothetical protein
LIWRTAVVATVGACASASPPPGGPEDRLPPKLVEVTPDTNAVNVRDGYVRFHFDETINDRGSGAQEVGNFFLVSPSDGSTRVNWHRTRIDVRPKNGFRPNTAYSVTLLPGLTDLRSNVMHTGATVVFSTGPTIPPERLRGTVFDWAAERPASGALVQAMTPDSVTYLAKTDSLGQFVVGPMPNGSYLVRAIVDANGNRALDRNEAFDSLTVTVPAHAPLELRTAIRDTLAPRIVTVSASDSVSLRVTFDRVLDPMKTLAAGNFRLVAADSSPIAIDSVLTPRDERARADSAQKIVADSARRADSLAGKVLRPVTPPGAGGAKPVPKPSVPPPYTTLLLHTARPLAPNATYSLTVTNARGLTGRTQSSERSFTTPKPAPPTPPSPPKELTPADSARRATPAPVRPSAPARG